jgi:hypothetical protein
MNAPRWDFLLFMTSVAGAATPALGQTVVPDIGQASSAAQSAASIPGSLIQGEGSRMRRRELLRDLALLGRDRSRRRSSRQHR